MSKETFIKGFCKAAEAAGIDPGRLAKYAAENPPPPIVRDGKARIDNQDAAFADIPAPNGDLSWLGSNKPVAVDVPGGEIRLPQGAQSITNNSHLVSFAPTNGAPRLIPTWWDGGAHNAKRSDGVRISYPTRDERIRALLSSLSSGKTKPLK